MSVLTKFNVNVPYSLFTTGRAQEMPKGIVLSVSLFAY